MQDIVIPVLTFCSVTSLGGAILAAKAIRRKTIQQRLQNQQAHRHHDEKHGTIIKAVEYLGSKAASGKTSVSLQEQLAKAGYNMSNAPTIFMGIKFMLLLAGVSLLTLILTPLDINLSTRLILISAGSFMLFFLPNLAVAVRRRKRCEEIRHHLPYALDLLEVCVSSGMGMDMAWNAVADEIRRVSQTLADEMALTNLEIHLGSPRAIAMRHMAERTEGQDLSSLVAVLVQSERFGTSIAEALRTFASSMRESRSMRAQETAEKMAVKLILPMVLFIFPALMIVMVGPAGLTLSKLLVD